MPPICCVVVRGEVGNRRKVLTKPVVKPIVITELVQMCKKARDWFWERANGEVEKSQLLVDWLRPSRGRIQATLEFRDSSLLAHLLPSPILYHNYLARQPIRTAAYRLSTLGYSYSDSFLNHSNDTTLDSPTAPLRQETTVKKNHGRRTSEIQTFVAQQLAPSSSA
jgi:hypothetical protein